MTHRDFRFGVVAATEGSGALAVGNIAGTNVVNLLFALGLGDDVVGVTLTPDAVIETYRKRTARILGLIRHHSPFLPRPTPHLHPRAHR